MRHSKGTLLASLAATTVAIGCASPAPPDPDPSDLDPLASATKEAGLSAAAPAAAEEGIRPPASEEDLAQRREIAASGRYLAKPSGDITIATPATMLASLDLPVALTPTVVSYTGPVTAATDRTSYGSIVPKRGTSFLLMSTGVATTDTAFAEPGTDHTPVGVGGDVATFIFRVTVPVGLNRFSFDYNFLSSESPEYVGQAFNDAFTVHVTDAGGRRQVAGASVNSSEFHPVSATSVGTSSPFLLYADIPSGVDTFTPGGLGREVDAGVTDFRRVDVSVSSGVVTIELDIRDIGDGILDSAVIVDNMAFSALELVDPRPGLIDEFGRVMRPPTAALASGGAAVHSVVADGVTQVLLRARVSGPGTASFSVQGGLPSDGSLSANATTLAWGPTVTNIPTVTLAGQSYVFALYRSPPDFNRGGDETARSRTATINMAFTPTSGGAVNQSVTLGIGRPPVVVIHDLWSNCTSWIDNTGSIMSSNIPPQNQPFTVSCASYDATSQKGLLANRTFVAEYVTQALEKQRQTGVAATQVDVIGHGLGGVLARRYVEEPSFARFDNFNAGTFNRLILMHTPNLGMRFADETVRMREFSKTRFVDPPLNTTTAWATISAIFEEASINILIDDDDCDAGGCNTTFDELRSASALINEIGLNNTPPRSVPTHAIVGVNGRLARRSQDVHTWSPTNVRNLYTRMEDNHPLTWDQAALRRQRLLFELPSTPGVTSDLFCDDGVAGPEDDHDLFTTTHEQAGGLPLPPVGTTPATPWTTTTFPVNGATATHFRVHNDPNHTTRLQQLLNEPASSGFFTTAMPAPVAVPRINHCPIPLFESPPIFARAAAAPPPRPLAAPTVTITSPVNGSSVVPGGNVTVTVATGGDGVPSALMLVGSDSAVFVESGPPYSVSFPIPQKALATMTLKAYAIYPLGQLAISQTISLNVASNAQLVSLEVIGGDAVMTNVGDTRQLTVLGLFSDGVTRDLSSPTRGTLYSRTSLSTVANVSTSGVVTAVGVGRATIIVRNGTKITSIDLQVKNRPPVAVCQSIVVCNDPGVCTANLPNLGAPSTDADGDLLTFQQLPAGPYPVGEHAVEVRVSDGRATRSCIAQIGVHACDAVCQQPPPPILWGDSAANSSR